MSVDAPDITAIVVNFRTPGLTLACVDSLRASVGVAVNIVVVDNDSRDDSVPRLRERFAGAADVRVDARHVNDGYTGGNNAGMVHARAAGAAFALVINSDAVVAPDCLRHLVAELEQHPDAALACPRIFYGEPADLLWFGGATYSPWRGRAVHVGHRRTADAGWQQAADLPFASGCALLIRLSSVADPVFDESLFAYAEDLDLSLRVRALGHRIRYAPDAIVWHFEGGSHQSSEGRARRLYLNTRNTLRVVGRHAQWYHWPILAPMLAVNVVLRYAAVALRDADVSAVGAVLRGARDAITGRAAGH